MWGAGHLCPTAIALLLTQISDGEQSTDRRFPKWLRIRQHDHSSTPAISANVGTPKSDTQLRLRRTPSHLVRLRRSSERIHQWEFQESGPRHFDTGRSR